MIVRLADMESDALALFDGARDFISRMDYTEFLPLNEDALLAGISHALTLPGVEIVVAEDDSRIVGGMGTLYAPFIWNPLATAAHEMFMWTNRDAPKTTLLRLLRFVEGRMKHHEADMREFAAMTSSPSGVEKLYKRMGLRKIHTMWAGMIG